MEEAEGIPCPLPLVGAAQWAGLFDSAAPPFEDGKVVAVRLSGQARPGLQCVALFVREYSLTFQAVSTDCRQKSRIWLEASGGVDLLHASGRKRKRARLRWMARMRSAA